MGLLDKAQKLKQESGISSTKNSPKAPSPGLRTLRYTTKLDDIYSYVEQQGSVSLNVLAAKFSIVQDEMENWLKTLESEGLLELCYPIAGKISARKIGFISSIATSTSQTSTSHNQGKKLINLLLFAVLVFASVMLLYMLYKNYAV